MKKASPEVCPKCGMPEEGNEPQNKKFKCGTTYLFHKGEQILITQSPACSRIASLKKEVEKRDALIEEVREKMEDVTPQDMPQYERGYDHCREDVKEILSKHKEGSGENG